MYPAKLFRSSANILGIALFAAVTLAPFPATAAASSGETAYVQIKTTKLMDQAKLWGKPVTTLSYGDAVEITGSEPKAGWIQVKTKSGKSGYLHQSALSSQRIVLRSGGSAGGNSDQSDVVLAGKGFNNEVERQFASGNSTVDFNAVDQMEQLRVSPAELAQFIKQGQLNP